MGLFEFIREKSTPFVRKVAYVALAAVTCLLSFILVFIPFCTYHDMRVTPDYTLSNTIQTLTPWSALSLLKDEKALQDGIAYLGIVLLLVWLLYIVILFVRGLKLLFAFNGKEEKVQKKAQSLLMWNTVVTGIYFVGGVLVNIINQAAGGATGQVNNIAPFLLCLLVDGVYAFYIGILRVYEPTEEEEEKKSVLLSKQKQLSKKKLQLFLFATCILASALLAFFSNIITVSFENGTGTSQLAEYGFSMNGIDLLKNYHAMESGGQILAFVLFLVLTLVLSFYFLAVLAYISKSDSFFRFAIGTIIISCLGCFLIGMYGKYYQMINALSVETIYSWMKVKFPLADLLGLEALKDTFTQEMKVRSTSFYYFLISLGLVGVLLIFRPYSKGLTLEKELHPDPFTLSTKIETAAIEVDTLQPKKEETKPIPAPVAQNVGGTATGNTLSPADPCPAFSELDLSSLDEKLALENKRASAFENPTLPKLVQFIVQYARDSRLHLFYTAEDIATFIAGLGATKLTILQGMSGTGKTSLPKIFTEALFSNCDIIEVESSWRDKNELLGYYNEFSKTYTPKKFTQALYKASLNPEVLTFIVLDEMNLSRIEYYFSDFLSLMENEEDKRAIKLLNVGLFKTQNGTQTNYRGLTRGHTLKIPSNVWFIGTANRDESTFEISDKVYDRAHTMNFNKRAKKVLCYNEPSPQKFLSANDFNRLLEESKKTVNFNVENYPVIAEVEKLLAPYNISFGNRIAKQIESFVAIYCACFTATEEVIHDAVERILLSKVISKLELKSVENKEELAAAFDTLNLPRCSEFVSKLNEE